QAGLRRPVLLRPGLDTRHPMTRQEITRPTSIDHELPHEPAATPNWSENYVFCGFDPTQAVGFYHHMARMPYDPEIWRGAFGMMLPDGRALVYKDHGRGHGNGDGPASPSLAFVCLEPFRRWEVRYDGVARITTREALTRGLLQDGPTVPVRLELVFEPSTPPWGFGD